MMTLASCEYCPVLGRREALYDKETLHAVQRPYLNRNQTKGPSETDSTGNIYYLMSQR